MAKCITSLRQRIAAGEGAAPASPAAAKEQLTAGFHELLGGGPGDECATLGLALYLAQRAIHETGKSCCICVSASEMQERGLLHGAGAASFGLQPDRLVMVQAAKEKELLWTLEEALTCGAFGAVIGALGRQERFYAFPQSRRLKLRALAADIPLFLLRHWQSSGTTAAHGRWRVSPLPSRSPGGHADNSFLGPPRIQLRLERMNGIRPQTWEMEFNAARNLHMAPLLEHGPAGKADKQRHSAS